MGLVVNTVLIILVEEVATMALSPFPVAVALSIFAIVTGANSSPVQAGSAAAGAEHTAPSSARVVLKPLTTVLKIYVQAKQRPAIAVRARRDALLSDLLVTSGSRVNAGQVIGHLGGPEMRLVLHQAQRALQAAQVTLKTDQSLLALAKERNKAHLTLRQSVFQATLARDDAQARVAELSTQLRLLQTQQTLRAPGNGVVSATPSVAGNSVKNGGTVVMIQPAKTLWLEGQVFGSAVGQLSEGQTGVFRPSDGSPPTTVTVSRLVPAQQGLGVRFSWSGKDATGDALMYAGKTGRVGIKLVQSPQPAVPSEALILDQGRWWVMLEDGKGVHAQAVDPIASSDGWTWLKGKVGPGDRVLVNGAYLSFHQSFSTRYQQLD